MFKAEGGDRESAEKLVAYYYEYKGDNKAALHWMKIAVRNGSNVFSRETIQTWKVRIRHKNSDSVTGRGARFNPDGRLHCFLDPFKIQ